jgi:protein O-mannosyl-transferase
VLACGWYVGKTFWPVGLAPFYPHPRLAFPWVQALLTGILLLVASLLIVMSNRRYLQVGWLWFLVTLLPILGLLQAGEQPWADRFTYVPQVGLLLLLVWGGHDLLARLRAPNWTRIGAAAVVAVACVAATWAQAARWRDSVTLLEYTLAVTQENPVAHNTLGAALLKLQQPAQAEAHFHEAIRLDPGFAKAYYNLGLALAELRQTDRAIAAYRQALAASPTFVPAHYNLATALAQQGQTADAIPYFIEALRLDSELAPAHHNLGVALVKIGKAEAAVPHFAAAIELDPEFKQMHFQTGFLLAAYNRPAEAVEHYRAALVDHPNASAIHYHLGRALAALEQWPQAVVALRQAAALQPTAPQPRAALAWALHHQGQIGAAQEEYRRVLELDPQWPQTATRQAWQMATAADADRRNGPWALALAEQAVHLSQEQDAAALDALAAAWAEQGGFNRAAATAHRALALATAQQPALAAAIAARLRGYEKDQPFRDAPAGK